MSEPSNLPTWLKSSHSPDHLMTAITVLTERERFRAAARNASRHKSHSSKAHRLSLGTSSSLLTKPAHMDYYSISVANRPENQSSNRYLDIEPYDRTRVVVDDDGTKLGMGGSQGRYLNANWVRELAGGKWWIATQAPLPNTAHAFLSVILQPTSQPPPDLIQSSSAASLPPSTAQRTSRVHTVVQLTQNFESGHRKAHVYFPPLPGQSWVVDPEPGCSSPSINVTLLSIKNIEDARCLQSTVSLLPVGANPNQEPVVFQHMLFGAWPDHAVPQEEDKMALLRFARLVDEVNKDLSSVSSDGANELDPDPPIMVNCSAGVGRTGAFIALSSLLRYYGLLSPTPFSSSQALQPVTTSPLDPLPPGLVDDLVVQEIDFLREQRPGMVQRQEQILLIYEFLGAALMGK